jgi:hypothetical protein
MNEYEKYVRELSDGVRQAMIENYEEFERTGVLGDEPLRIHAENIQALLKIDGYITFVMKELAFECFRFYTREYFTYRFGETE